MDGHRRRDLRLVPAGVVLNAPPAPLDVQTRIAAYCVVEDGAGRLLLCRLSISELDHAKWTLPGGGVEFGEDPAHAAIRELEEETGLRGTVKGLLGIDSRVYGPNRFRAGRLHAIRIVYGVAVQGDELRHERSGSTDRAQWFSRVELGSLPLVDLVGVALAMLDASRAESGA